MPTMPRPPYDELLDEYGHLVERTDLEEHLAALEREIKRRRTARRRRG